MEDRRPVRRSRVDDELVERGRAGEGTEDTEHSALRGQLEDLARIVLRHGLRSRNRPSDNARLAVEPSLDRIGEEDAAGTDVIG